GEGETGFDFFGERAEVAVVEGDGVPAADDGGARGERQALFSHGSVGHADGSDLLGLDDFPGVGGCSDEVEAVEGWGGCGSGGGHETVRLLSSGRRRGPGRGRRSRTGGRRF